MKKLSFHKFKAALTICLAFLFTASVSLAALPFNSTFADSAAESSEELPVDPTGKGSGYSAVMYDNTNGLPTSEANAIAETSEGFIWIGSYSGLIRYDGKEFERMDSTNGIASVVSLFVDSRDRLWVGTNDSGAAVMENGEFRMYNRSDGLPALSVRSIVEDENGNIYIGTTHGLVMIDNDMELQHIDEPEINEEYIRMLRKGSDNVIYGITMDGAVFTLSDGVLTGFYEADELGVSAAHSLIPDPDAPGWVYIATKNSEVYHGELKKGFKEAEPADVSPLTYLNSISRINGMTWICADNGIGFIKDGESEVTVIKNIPLNTSIENIMTDYQGNLWFVSSQQGVMKIVRNQFTDIYEQYGIEDEVVYSTCMHDGQLFVGTKTSGLRVLSDGETVDSIPIKRSVSASGSVYSDTDLITMLSGCKIRSIIRDSKNRIWFSTFGDQALVRYDDGVVTKFTEDDGLPSNRVRAVFECADGSVVAACTGGAAIIENDSVTKVYDESSGISNTELLTAVEAGNGDIVIGTDGDGIYVLNDKDTLHFTTESGLYSDVIMRIKKDDSRDIYWIVTSNSIAYMTEDYTITTIKNFPYSNNFDLYEASNGEMWVLSSNGIYVAPVEQLLANKEIDPVFYGEENGLSCITTSNSYSELTEDGDLYISGTTGISKVNIDKPFESVSGLKAAVPFVDADGVRIYPDSSGKFRLSSDVRKLTIYSYVYNYSLIDPQISYTLDGFDSRETTLKRSELAPIYYTNLRGGSYNFIMNISDVQGNSSSQLKVQIVKEKQVHEQIWFRMLCVILVFMCIALAFKLYFHYRAKKFLKKEQENKLLIREMVEAFAKMIDMKDKYTNGHSTRVAEYTAMLTKELGYDEETVEKYYNIALLHDIGKIGIPPEILSKPGKLTDTEFNIIKSHSALGSNALKNISIMPELAIGAGAHHERPDGKGYPKGLKGDEIPRVAQIIAVADTFDAMYSDRPYRKRMNFDKAVSIVKEVRGTQLTSDVVDAFLRLVDKGEFRAADDNGGGTTEDIDNIRKKFDEEKK